jgi:hypothetical protein
MRLDKIGQLSAVLRAQYDKEHRAIADILTQESGLRKQLRQLDEQVAQNREDCKNYHELQAVGAHLSWQSWTTKTRLQLNTELAQVMVKKLVAMDQVRLAFGRQRAVEIMQSTEHHERMKRYIKRRNSDLI